MPIRICHDFSCWGNMPEVSGKKKFLTFLCVYLLTLFNLVFEGKTLSQITSRIEQEEGNIIVVHQQEEKLQQHDSSPDDHRVNNDLVSVFQTNATNPDSTDGQQEHHHHVNGNNSSTSNNTITDDRSQKWIPSDAWIESCVQQQYKTNLSVPYKVQWVLYRLGDCINVECRHCRDAIKASGLKELSIAGEYWRGEEACNKTASKNNTIINAANAGANLAFLNKLFDRYKTNPYPYNESWRIPEDDELVIHLRLGDVMDLSWYVGKKTTPFQMLRDGHETNHGPSTYYPNGIRSISQYLSIIRESGLTKVALKGGSHRPEAFPKSKVYTQCLADAIRAAGYNVTTLRVNGEDNPDQDLYYMSHAKYFVRSTGGYSRLISRLVEERGGTVLDRDFPKQVRRSDEERQKRLPKKQVQKPPPKQNQNPPVGIPSSLVKERGGMVSEREFPEQQQPPASQQDQKPPLPATARKPNILPSTTTANLTQSHSHAQTNALSSARAQQVAELMRTKARINSSLQIPPLAPKEHVVPQYDSPSSKKRG